LPPIPALSEPSHPSRRRRGSGRDERESASAPLHR